jgi:REP element-mobilizing transposase RayT
VLCLALDSGSDREGFRVVHFSAQSNHVHLIVEARDKQRLARGLQGLKVRLAKGLNKLWRRRGAVFADRYHALLLKTPRQVRNALRYVLTNAIKHGLKLDPGAPDPFSSGDVFHGWNRIPDLELGWTSLGLVAKARTWLLRTGVQPGTWVTHLTGHLGNTRSLLSGSGGGAPESSRRGTRHCG